MMGFLDDTIGRPDDCIDALEDHERTLLEYPAVLKREALEQSAAAAAAEKTRRNDEQRKQNELHAASEAERNLDPERCDLKSFARFSSDALVRAWWPAIMQRLQGEQLKDDRWLVPIDHETRLVIRMRRGDYGVRAFGKRASKGFESKVVELAIEFEAQNAADERAALLAAMDFGDDTQPPSWLLDGVIGAGLITNLVGKKGTGKSTVAESWMQAIATGRDWLGRRVSQPGPVISIQLEMGQGIDLMFRNKIASGMNIPIEDLKGKRLRYPYPFKLDNPEAVEQLENVIDQTNPVLLVIDSFSAAHSQASENDAALMKTIMVTLQRLRDEYGVAILCLVHANAEGQVRGSTEIATKCDNELLLERAGAKLEALITITNGKVRFASESIRMRFRGKAGVDEPMIPELVTETKPKGPVTSKGAREVAEYVREHGPIGLNALAAGCGVSNKGTLGELLREANDAGLLEQGEDKKWSARPTTDEDS